jgi:elongation factor 1-gamma
MALTLYTYPGNPRANKALIAAQYNGVEIKIPADFVMGESNKTPEFLALNPLGKVPTLETAEGGIFESNAIARYVAGLRADTPLLGASYFESGQVQMWQDFASTHVDLPVSNWVYQILGWMQYNPQITKKAEQDVMAAMKIMDSHLLAVCSFPPPSRSAKVLSHRTLHRQIIFISHGRPAADVRTVQNSFFVGSQITLADITLVCSLDLPYRMVFEPNCPGPPGVSKRPWRSSL